MRLLTEIALVALAAVGVAVSVALLPEVAPRRRRAAQGAAPGPPEQLAELQRLVSSAGTNDLHVHAYLRPLLAEIASRRLAGRSLALERMSAATGQQLLGHRLWDIVRPHRPFPEDREAPGVSPQELSTMLSVLEAL